MNEALTTYCGIVYPWQCDHMGHMNVQWYVEKFDQATWRLLAQLGLSGSRLRREGLGMAAVEQKFIYKRELHAGDALTVHSCVLEVKDKAIRIRHEMRDDETGDVAAAAVMVGVHLDAATRKARSLPEDVRQRALSVVRASRPDDVELQSARGDRNWVYAIE